MTPYYDDGHGIVVYHGDNRDVLPALEAGSVDLVFTSPPYNIGEPPDGRSDCFYPRSRGGRSMTKRRNFTGYRGLDDALPMDEYIAWQQGVLTECWRLLDDSGAVFYNHKPRIVEKRLWMPLELNPGLPLRQIVTWYGAAGVALGDAHYCPSYEWLMVFTKPAFRLVDRRASSVTDFWYIPRETEDYGHPATFPVGLPQLAIQTAVCSAILDPFVGSGTTLVAAKMLGRHGIGIEIDERYCEIAAKRLSQEVMTFGRLAGTTPALAALAVPTRGERQLELMP